MSSNNNKSQKIIIGGKLYMYEIFQPIPEDMLYWKPRRVVTSAKVF